MSTKLEELRRLNIGGAAVARRQKAIELAEPMTARSGERTMRVSSIPYLLTSSDYTGRRLDADRDAALDRMAPALLAHTDETFNPARQADLERLAEEYGLQGSNVDDAVQRAMALYELERSTLEEKDKPRFDARESAAAADTSSESAKAFLRQQAALANACQEHKTRLDAAHAAVENLNDTSTKDERKEATAELSACIALPNPPAIPRTGRDVAPVIPATPSTEAEKAIASHRAGESTLTDSELRAAYTKVASEAAAASGGSDRYENASPYQQYMLHQLDTARAELDATASLGDIVEGIPGQSDGSGYRPPEAHPATDMSGKLFDDPNFNDPELNAAAKAFDDANAVLRAAQAKLQQAYETNREHELDNSGLEAVDAHIKGDDLKSAFTEYEAAAKSQTKASEELFDKARLANHASAEWQRLLAQDDAAKAAMLRGLLNSDDGGKRVSQFADAVGMRDIKGEKVSGKMKLISNKTFGGRFLRNIAKEFPLLTGMFMLLCFAVSKMSGKGLGCFENVDKLSLKDRFEMLHDFMKDNGAELSKLPGISLTSQRGSAPKITYDRDAVAANHAAWKAEKKQWEQTHKGLPFKKKEPISPKDAEALCKKMNEKFEQHVHKEIEARKPNKSSPLEAKEAADAPKTRSGDRGGRASVSAERDGSALVPRT